MTSRVFRRSLRMAGLTILVAGGWCCWLTQHEASSTTETETFRDWSGDQPSAAASPQHPPKAFAAEITGVIPAAGVEEDIEAVILAELEEFDGERADVKPVRHEKKIASAASETESAAWLTGTIEVDEEAAQSRGKKRSPPAADKRPAKPKRSPRKPAVH